MISVRAQALGSGASVVVACGIFPDQGSNPCPLHWEADSSPLDHQGRPDDVLKDQILSLSSVLGVAFSLRLEILLGMGGLWCPEIRSKKSFESFSEEQAGPFLESASILNFPGPNRMTGLLLIKAWSREMGGVTLRPAL